MTRRRSDGSLNARSVGPVRLTAWNADGWLVWLRFRWWRARTVTSTAGVPRARQGGAPFVRVHSRNLSSTLWVE